jgi:hypothetical protein
VEIVKAVCCSFKDPGDRKLRRAISAARRSLSENDFHEDAAATSEAVLVSDAEWAATDTAHISPTEKDAAPGRECTEKTVLDHINLVARLGKHRIAGHPTSSGQSVGKRSRRRGSLIHRTRGKAHSKRSFSGIIMIKPVHLVAASKDFLGIAQVISCFPIDFMMSLARGFHYMPTLWGDETVRQASRIVDFQGGLKAAGKVWKFLLVNLTCI